MALPLIGYPNRIDEGTLSGGSWRAASPLTNVADPDIKVPARSTDASVGSTRFDLDVGAGNEKQAALAGLFGHSMSLDGEARILGTPDGDALIELGPSGPLGSGGATNLDGEFAVMAGVGADVSFPLDGLSSSGWEIAGYFIVPIEISAESFNQRWGQEYAYLMSASDGANGMGLFLDYRSGGSLLSFDVSGAAFRRVSVDLSSVASGLPAAGDLMYVSLRWADGVLQQVDYANVTKGDTALASVSSASPGSWSAPGSFTGRLGDLTTASVAGNIVVVNSSAACRIRR